MISEKKRIGSQQKFIGECLYSLFSKPLHRKHKFKKDRLNTEKFSRNQPFLKDFMHYLKVLKGTLELSIVHKIKYMI